ncbi:MAG: hypothetical protein Q8M16_11505 [Pirellulaceae bacterium]|nr:hypothetical protein [Pirellulaceae bacterium]
MTTPAEILTQLQAAWGVVPAVSGSPAFVSPVLELLGYCGKFEPCGAHVPPFDAVEETDNRRPGFIRSKCRQCGRFLGYRREC